MKQLPPYYYGEGATEEQQPDYSYRIVLGDAEYRVDLHYNGRDGLWRLDLYDADDTPILLGRRCAINAPLLSAHPRDAMPNVELVLLDAEASGVECDFEALGVRCLLISVDPDDIPEQEETDLVITEVT